MRHHQGVLLDLVEEAGEIEVGDDFFPRREPVEPAITLRRHIVEPRVGVEDVDHRQVVPLADREIIEIVRRGDLDRTTAGLGVGVFIGDDRDQPADERQPHRFPDQLGIARIIGMHRDRGVAEHGFGPGGRDHDKAPRLALDRIADMPQKAFGLAAVDLEVGDDRVHLRVPIDQPLVAVNQPLAIQLDEDPAHRGGQSRVHRKPLARPIRRAAEPAQLVDDRAAGLGLPLPDALDEFVAAERALVDLPLGKLVGHDDLGGDAGVIGAGLPQHVAPAQALIADQHILQGESQRMAHMQAAGHVRRRHHDRIGRFCAAGVGGERAGGFPQRVAAPLHRGGLEGFVQHRRTVPG